MKKPLQGLQKQGSDKAAQATAAVKKALPAGVPTPGAPKASSRATPKPFTASKSPVAPAPAATVEQAAKAVAAPVQQVCCSVPSRSPTTLISMHDLGAFPSLHFAWTAQMTRLCLVPNCEVQGSRPVDNVCC